MAAAIAAAALLWSTALPAFAHEFTVVLVTAGSAQSEDARRGFQVAVDESPDVSHALDGDAGDHLGGVDVNLVAINHGESRSTVGRVGDLLDGGATAVVVLLVPSAAEAIVAAAAERDKLALVVSDSAAASGQRQSLLLRPRDLGADDEARTAAAATALRDALGDEPTPPALLGYDAGRLLDKITGRAGAGLQPSEALTRAALAANALLASSRVVGPAERAAAGETDRDQTSGAADIGTAAAVTAVALFAAGAIVQIRRRRPR